MMRIKEAVQRRRLIQALNEDYAAAISDDAAGNYYSKVEEGGEECGGSGAVGPVLYYVPGAEGRRKSTESFGRHDSIVSTIDHHHAYLRLQEFAHYLSVRLSDGQRRALRVTWRRLSEAPKTSGRGALQIMQRVFEQVVQREPQAMPCFYRSAFLKCMDDAVQHRSAESGTIATLRDHAHLLIDLIDGVMCVMFERPLLHPVWDPATIGRAHTRLQPMGLRRQVWHLLGECLAEVMFAQECVRAYPLAASAWSAMSICITDVAYSNMRVVRDSNKSIWRNPANATPTHRPSSSIIRSSEVGLPQPPMHGATTTTTLHSIPSSSRHNSQQRSASSHGTNGRNGSVDDRSRPRERRLSRRGSLSVAAASNSRSRARRQSSSRRRRPGRSSSSRGAKRNTTKKKGKGGSNAGHYSTKQCSARWGCIAATTTAMPDTATGGNHHNRHSFGKKEEKKRCESVGK